MDSLSVIIASAVVSAIGTIVKTIKFIHEGEQGIRLRFGKAQRNKDGSPKIIHPGFVLMVPFVDTLKRHHVRQQTLKFEDQKIMISGGLVFNVSAIIIMKVKDIYKALFEIDDLDNSVIDIAMGILREVLAIKRHTELNDMESISSELLKKIRIKADEWGVEFLQFNLTDCAATPESASLVNAESGVELKLKALTMAAKTLGIELSDIPESLAATLVGVPLVVSVNGNAVMQRVIRQKPSMFNINFGGSEENRRE